MYVQHSNEIHTLWKNVCFTKLINTSSTNTWNKQTKDPKLLMNLKEENERSLENLFSSLKCSKSFSNVSDHNVDCNKKSFVTNCNSFLEAKKKIKTLHTIIFPKVYAESVENNKVTVSTSSNENASLVSDAEVLSYLEKETARDRLKFLFTKRVDDSYHSDLQLIYMSVCTFTGLAFMSGCVRGSTRARELFVRKHKSTKWPTRFLAARAMQDVQIIGGIRQGMNWAFTMLIFSSCCLLLSKTLETYRNKSGVIEYSIPTAITAGIVKFNKGFKGMMVASLVGFTLGTFGGLVAFAIVKSTDLTQDKKHFDHIKEMLETEKAIANIAPKKTSTEESPTAVLQQSNVQ